ncbi:phospholipase A2 inhibitor NAI-like [Clarias gariepinus]|uniref:phospholipase A2 inhibitor NAI-like n=1 Tax=Clarias gariepinus TaxID=13013 RepID=UPI00234C2423|nr:phospholipase A2 inhibitor NAI-like [Clarias gariepinus]
MKSQVTLLLTCMLFSKALSLTCQKCIPVLGICTSEQVTCSDQCLTSSTSVYMSGTKLTDNIIQSCGTSEKCVSGSLNLGAIEVTTSTQCCNTNLCNTRTPPKLSEQSPNGGVCYTCGLIGCSGLVSCKGDEDRCITASVQQLGITVSMKGCASESLCVAAASSSIPGISATNVKCCKGSLCNGAGSFKRNFLLHILPLLCSALFF